MPTGYGYYRCLILTLIRVFSTTGKRSLESVFILESKDSGRCQKDIQNSFKHLKRFVERSSECHIIKSFLKLHFTKFVTVISSVKKTTNLF